MQNKHFCETENIKHLAGFDFLDVCLLGETGTGKTHTARLIHSLSPRSNKPFVAVNCAELSASIIEAELFGYEKGAFTGATFSKTGKFEAATGGTLFLDEIGELSSEMQAKLLKVVEEKHITRVGSIVARPVNLRIIYATNRDLCVFREDLRYRVAAHTIKLKPLRERPEEILPLAHRFIADFSRKSGREIAANKNALRVLERAHWRGNVRELRSFIEKVCLDAIFLADWHNSQGEKAQITEVPPEILLSYLPQSEFYPDKTEKTAERHEPVNFKAANYRQEVKDYDRQLIKWTLKKNNGNVSRTAIELGLSRYGLIKKIKRYKINDDEE
ncbi:MAG: sigma-54 dependent transcriptional regulator [Pyrinomonadaceae bacterium]